MLLKFIEVYVSTPIEICEQRDSKGLYQKARRGEITSFTGIDAPYEAPENAEIVIDAKNSVKESVQIILDYLHQEKLI